MLVGCKRVIDYAVKVQSDLLKKQKIDNFIVEVHKEPLFTRIYFNAALFFLSSKTKHASQKKQKTFIQFFFHFSFFKHDATSLFSFTYLLQDLLDLLLTN